MPTLRTTEVDLVGSNEALKINLDLLEERREEAAIREAKSKAKMEKYYNSKVAHAEGGDSAGADVNPFLNVDDAELNTVTCLCSCFGSRVRRIKENIAKHRSALCDVFVPLFEPLSITALTCTKITLNVIPATVDTTTALSVTPVSASLIPPISIGDYEVAHAEGGDSAGADVNPFLNVDDAELNTSLTEINASLTEINASFTLTEINASLNEINALLTEINASLNEINASLTEINASLTDNNHYLHQQCKLFSMGNSLTWQWEHSFTSSGKIL
nr:reverse transcriptase domain-containing protein [Tanacetum cinerariifolium]